MADAPHLGGWLEFDGNSWTPWLWSFLIDTFKPVTALDVGCGRGHAARFFLDLGVDAYGIDGSAEARKMASIPQDRFFLHDFTTGPAPMLWPVDRFDLVWSCEFVEHVEESFVDNVLDILSRGKVVAMTHATPGQDGWHHVNCQPRDYWVDKMNSIGYQLDVEATTRSHAYPPEIVAQDVLERSWWGRSGMIFARRTT